MDKKIKIYYSIPEYYPPFRVDISELFAKSLAQQGVETIWYMGTNEIGGGSREKEYFGQSSTIPPRYSGKGVGVKIFNKVAYWIYDSKLIIKSILQDYDIVQVRDKYIVAIIGLIFAKIFNRPYVYWCSYPYPEHSIEMARKLAGSKKLGYLLQGYIAKFILYKIVMKYADHSFVQSKKMLADIAEYGVNIKRMTPVPMGVPDSLLDWVQSNSITVVPKTIVYLGTLSSVRRLNTIIESFSLVLRVHPDAKLIMVGDGDFPEERYDLEELAKKLNISSSVQFTGFVPINQAWTIAASAAICLSPFYPTKILSSTSPTKLVEYLALGRPVVCNNHPEQSEIIAESGAGICIPWSAIDFASAISKLLDDPQLAEQMASCGPVWVKEHRTYTDIANIVRSEYSRIIGTTQ